MNEKVIKQKILKTSQLVEDKKQPRRDFGLDGDKNRILESIKKWGVLRDLLVLDRGNDTYLILDGHRRFRSAKKLKIEELACKVLPKNTSKGDLELIRYEAQNNRRSWKPLERSAALNTIREETGMKPKEIAKALNMSSTVVTNSLNLKKIEERYMNLLRKYELLDEESYIVEFVKLYPKIRDIDEFKIKDVVDRIFYKTRHEVINSAKEYRTISRVVKRTEANKKELLQFLKNDDMGVKQLAENTILSGLSLQIEELTRSIAKRLQKGKGFEEKEKVALSELKEVTDTVL